MREVTLTPTHTSRGIEENPPVYIYDTSGPYTDPKARIDLMAGLADIRTPWIEARGDTETLAGPSSAFGHRRQSDPALASLRFEHLRTPRRAKPGANVSQMHYARAGIVTPEMEYVAIRENMRLDELRADPRYAKVLRQHRGQSFGASLPETITPEFVRDEVARGPGHHPRQHQPPGTGAHDHRAQLPGEDQHQHRQLGGHLLHRGGGGEDGLVRPLGRRHPDGSVHRQEHPRDPRVDPAQCPHADRHRAHLPGPGEGRRQARGTDLGAVPRHPDRTGRAGGGLLHHPRRGPAALCPAHRRPGHRHRLPRRLDPGQVVPGPSPGELPLYPLRGHLRDHEGL